MRKIYPKRIRRGYIRFIIIILISISIPITSISIGMFWQLPREILRIIPLVSIFSVFITGLIFVGGMNILPMADMYFSFLYWKKDSNFDEKDFGFDIFTSQKKIKLGKSILVHPDIQLYEFGFSCRLTFEGWYCGIKVEYQNIRRIYYWKLGDTTGLQLQTRDYKTCIVHSYGSSPNMAQITDCLREKVDGDWDNINLQKGVPYPEFLLHHDDVPLDWRTKWRTYIP